MASEHVETLKSLHRGEIAATETYVQALDKFEGDGSAETLTAIRNDHRDFANELRQHVHEVGAEPDQSSGSWGAWAKFVEGGAQMLGKTAALKALKEGEEHGINSYEDALDKPIPDECKAAIRGRLIPKTRQHIDALSRLMEAD